MSDPNSPLLPPLFSDLPAALATGFRPEAPWELLGEPFDRLLADLPAERFATPPPPDVHLLGERIVLGRGVRLSPGAVLEGPIFLDDDVEVRPGAYLRGGVWAGRGAVIGTNTELKRAIMLPGAKAPHLSYVGDSLLGAGVNLGAGTILSNFRQDGAEITIPLADGRRLATGRRKLGAILGDGVRTGCNCVLHPGVIVGRGTSLYPGAHLRGGVYPADSIVKLRQQLEIVEAQPG